MAYGKASFYFAICDGCRTHDGHRLRFPPQDSALARAEKDGWKVQDDGRLLCHPCRWLPGGDLHETGLRVVGTPAEAEACGRRSGLGLGDVEHHQFEEL